MDGDGFVDLNARLLDKSLHQDDRNKSGVRVDGRNLPPFIVPQQGKQQPGSRSHRGRAGGAAANICTVRLEGSGWGEQKSGRQTLWAVQVGRQAGSRKGRNELPFARRLR